MIKAGSVESMLGGGEGEWGSGVMTIPRLSFYIRTVTPS